jgi:integrase
MASIWKHPHSKYWTACFRDADGRQRRVSTKTTDRRIARRIADEYEKATRGKRTLHQLEKVLRSYHEELSGEAGESRSLRGFCAEWLAEKEPSVSHSTILFYRAVAAKLCAFFGHRADEPIREITRANLVAFRASLAEQVSPTTANHDMVAVKALFAAALAAGRLAENPTEFIKPIRSEPDTASRRPFTVPELHAVLAVAGPEWQSLIKIGLYSGARLGDVATLKWADVDLDKWELRWTTRKTRNSILIPIAGPLRDHLMTLAASDDASGYLHPEAARSVAHRGNSAALSDQFGSLLAEAGLRPPKSTQTGGRTKTGETRRRTFEALSYHSLRHTFISFLKASGAAQATAMELAGHSSVAMSELYTHSDRASMERAMTSLPAL